MRSRDRDRSPDTNTSPADGRPLGQLGTGDRLDGAVVAFEERVPYGGGYTYDLLVDGDARAYWADGVLLGSTLG